MKTDDKLLIQYFLRIGKHLLDTLNRSFSPRGIYIGQARVLITLSSRGTMNQNSICKELDLKPATITVMLQKMEKSGLIVRSQDADDDRVMNVSLTDSGKEVARFVIHTLKEVDLEFRSILTEEDIEKLTAPLQKIYSKHWD